MLPVRKPLVEHQYSDRLMIKLLEAKAPDQFRRQKVALFEGDLESLTDEQVKSLIAWLEEKVLTAEALAEEEKRGSIFSLTSRCLACTVAIVRLKQVVRIYRAMMQSLRAASFVPEVKAVLAAPESGALSASTRFDALLAAGGAAGTYSRSKRERQ